jgi:hypothetical protein
MTENITDKLFYNFFETRIKHFYFKQNIYSQLFIYHFAKISGKIQTLKNEYNFSKLFKK